MSALGRRPKLAAGVTLATLALLVLWRVSGPGGTLDRALARPEVGGITVREATLRRRPTAWLLDARADIELPPAIRAGLDSGVPLEFVLELSLREPRAFLPDRSVLDVTRRYGLVYYELTRHYRVRSFEDGTGRNYRSLPTALVGLGTLRDVPLGGGTDESLVVGAGAVSERPTEAPSGASDAAPADLPSAVPVHARLSLRLDDHVLPLPLQSPLGSTWRLASEPYTWTHSPESQS